jgi:hypothetical protein
MRSRTWTAVAVAGAICAVTSLTVGGGGGAGATPPAPSNSPRPAPTGVSKKLHASLVKAGAFGSHPIQLLILGDSIALTLGIGLSKKVKSVYGLHISNHASLGCDLDPQLQVKTDGKPGPATLGCENWRAQWPYLVASEHPQVVALGLGRWENLDHYFDGQWVHIGQPIWDNHVISDLDHAISVFELFGAKVVLFTMPYIDPSDVQPDGAPWPENTPSRVRAYNALVAKVARSHRNVTVIPLNHLLSPKGVYTSKVDGVRTRWLDRIHISILGGQFLQPAILPVIDRLGLQAETTQRATSPNKKATTS